MVRHDKLRLERVCLLRHLARIAKRDKSKDVRRWAKRAESISIRHNKLMTTEEVARATTTLRNESIPYSSMRRREKKEKGRKKGKKRIINNEEKL